MFFKKVCNLQYSYQQTKTYTCHWNGHLYRLNEYLYLKKNPKNSVCITCFYSKGMKLLNHWIYLSSLLTCITVVACSSLFWATNTVVLVCYLTLTQFCPLAKQSLHWGKGHVTFNPQKPTLQWVVRSVHCNHGNRSKATDLDHVRSQSGWGAARGQVMFFSRGFTRLCTLPKYEH